MKIFPLLLTCCFVALLGCQDRNSGHVGTDSNIFLVDVPSTLGGQPNLFLTYQENIILSWIEYFDDSTDALVFSNLFNNQWSNPKTIAQGSDWFVNWADFPSVVAYQENDNFLAAHWLQKSAEGTYDYDVRIAQSTDGGNTWGTSFIPHRDSIAAEHGFVSMLPLSNGRIFATWLDGRNTKGGNDHAINDHGHHGAMTLRAAEFDIHGNLYNEVELDEKVCDCCQTSATESSEGLIVAYRDRSDEELRDISIVRRVNNKWSDPMNVFEDNWEIAGCPVNGPVIQSFGNTIAVAWYTAAGGEPKVQLAFSNDKGQSFDDPIQINSHSTLGRIGLLLPSTDQAQMVWIESINGEAYIQYASVDRRKGVIEKQKIALISASRNSGFPVMTGTSDYTVVAWTAGDDSTYVQSVIIR